MWHVAASVDASLTEYLTGTLSATFNSDTGQAVLNNLILTDIGRHIFTIVVTSIPPEYILTSHYVIDVIDETMATIVTDVGKLVEMTFNVNYDNIIKADVDALNFGAMVGNHFARKHRTTLVKDIQVNRGRII